VENKKFTILSGSRNCKRFLDQYCKSILSQKYRPLQVVFVDDFSKDGSYEFMATKKRLFHKYKIEFVLIKNKQRKYCGSTYNIAFKKSDGFFYGVVDSDDMLVKGAVEHIMNIYNKYTSVGWIYTQFNIFNDRMRLIKKGFCSAPKQGQSLLDLGKKRIHGYSHWRTFSRRVPKIETIFSPGERSALDKYMGYRLEELADGMFYNKVLYNYRQRKSYSISTTERTKSNWRKIIKQAIQRRKDDKITPFDIKRK